MTQDHREAQDRLAQQGLRVLQAHQDFAVQMALLALEAQMAWLDLWVLPASADLWDQADRQARVARLVRRGVPAGLARQGLKVV